MRVFLGQLRPRLFLGRLLNLALDSASHQVIADLLRVPGRSMNLVRVFFEDRNPILDIGRAALRVMSDADTLPGHHGADLGPQFLAGVLTRPKAVFESVLERVAVHAIRVAGRMAALVKRLAHFVNGTWITDLVFVNLETQPSRPAPTPFHTAILPSRPVIYFYDTEGTLVAPESVVEVTGDLEITEDGALTVQTEMEPLGVLTISTHGRGELVSGSVRVVSEGPIGGMLRFEHPALGVAGVGASPPVSDALFPVRRQEGGITTGVALHNLESSPGLLRCDLMREGVLLDAASIPLEANGQTAWLIDQAFPAADTSDFAGLVRCDAVGEGLFSAVALEMDPGNRIFTTLPVVPVPEMPSQE